MSTGSTSRRMPRWPGASSRSWCQNRQLTTRSPFCEGCATATKRTHQVRYTDEALVAAVELSSDRYITDRFLPDKAIDLIDQAGARVRLRMKTPSIDLRDLERQAEQLTRDKEQAVASEQYEQASQLRDQIEEIRNRVNRLSHDRRA